MFKVFKIIKLVILIVIFLALAVFASLRYSGNNEDKEIIETNKLWQLGNTTVSALVYGVDSFANINFKNNFEVEKTQESFRDSWENFKQKIDSLSFLNSFKKEVEYENVNELIQDFSSEMEGVIEEIK